MTRRRATPCDGCAALNVYLYPVADAPTRRLCAQCATGQQLVWHSTSTGGGWAWAATEDTGDRRKETAP